MTLLTLPTQPTDMDDVASETLLRLRDVAVTYEPAQGPVVHVTDFALRRGEAVLFLGPSGCGKSTAAMVCAGLIPGTVNAQVTGDVWREARLTVPGAVGYVFQDADVQFCMLEVADEIAFGLENRNVSRESMPARILDGLQGAGLDSGGSEAHAAFSGGMKQKLAIACALAMEAELFIFDEPTANLDPHSTRQVFDQIGALHDAGRTMLVIEHKFDRLLAHMDRVVLFGADGRIHRTGPTLQVVREEWAWMVDNGIVAPWKTRPFELTAQEHVGVRTQAPVMVDSRQAGTDGEAPVLQLRNGRCQYGAQPVWSGVDLDIRRGDLTAIVGPNGAGKSSLLQVLAGIQTLQAGTLTVLGRPLADWKRGALMPHIGFCFQNPEFQFIFERVGDEAANRIVADQVPSDALALLAEFGLAGTELQSPYALSQGQKRRLSVAVMVREPHDLYLLDEPTFGQDAITQQAIMDRLQALVAGGRTVVMSTHDMDLVQRYATHVIVLADGRVQFAGSPRDLSDHLHIMAAAHLRDDGVSDEWRPTAGTVSRSEDASPSQAPVVASALAGAPRSTARASRRRSPASRLNPAMQLVTTMAVMVVATFAHTLPQALAMFVFSLLALPALAWLTPVQILKRLAPFLIFYVSILWSFSAYAAVGPQTRTFAVLWMHFSLPGLEQGLILALRMLAAVTFGLVFISSVDVTALVVALCQNFRLSPRFAYGGLAGLRFLPLFQSEWTKLRKARQLRGKDAKSAVLRPVMYALPLLSQAIRMSERVAIAMEARGFVGRVSTSASARTYYREVRIRRGDYVYGVAMMTMVIALLIWF